MKISRAGGHGFNTAGKRTVDGSMREWEFNSAVVEKMGKKLAEYEGVEQLRLDDPTGRTDISLTERTRRSNAWGADIHVDVHANAFGNGGWNDVGGIETFVMTPRSQHSKSVELAAQVQNQLLRATGLKNRGVKEANFHMLREIKAPVRILVECGFMTNKEEARLLKQDSYREKCADAIVKGIVEFAKLKKKSKPAASKPVQTGGNTTSYTVKAGDVLGKIANRFGVTVEAIARANGLKNPNMIRVGQKLTIPVKTYTVQRGDTLSGIASRHKTTSAALAKKNGIKDPNKIRVGQVIKL